MPAATSIAIAGTAIGLASTAASMGASFGQAAKQKKAAQQAQEKANQAFADAKKKLEINYYKGLSIQKEPYELEREALAQSGAQAMEAARETGRQVAPTAGRVQMAQNVGQRQIAGAMGQEMAGLEQLTATEESRLRDARAQLDLEQAAGAQDAAAQAQQFASQAQQQGIQGAISIGSQVAQAMPLYGKQGGAIAADRLENQYNKLAASNKLGPQFYDTSGKALPFQQAVSKLPGYESYKSLAPDAFNAQFTALDAKKIRGLQNQFLTPDKYGNMQTISPVNPMFNIPAVQYNMPLNTQNASYNPNYFNSVSGILPQ